MILRRLRSVRPVSDTTQVHRRRRYVVPASLAGLAALWGVAALAYGAARESPTIGELELALEQVLPLPASWTVRDFLPLRDGSILFVLHHPGRVAWFPDTAAVLRMPSRVLIGAAERDDGMIELVDRVHKVVLRVSPPPTASVVESQPIDADLILWDAELHDQRWLVLAGDSAEPATVHALEEGVLRQLAPPIAGVPARLARLNNLTGRIAVAEMAFPFRVFVLNGHEWRTVSPDEARPWTPVPTIALDVIGLGDVGLQTLVDQTSRKRVLRLFSLRTGVGRSRLIEVPVTLTKLDAKGRVVGIRRSNVEEVVSYSWRWR